MINAKLPATCKKQYYTSADNQSMVKLSIYESRSTENNMKLEDRQPITSIDMKFTKPVPKETPLDVTFALDNSGILHIIAEELAYHSKLETTFQLSNQLSENEMAIASSRTTSATVE